MESLVGRQAELTAVAELTDAYASRPAALFLVGEAGIGKTRLLKAAVEQAEQRGHRVLVARASGAEVQLSFAGLGDLLRRELDEGLAALPPPQRRAIESALLIREPAAVDDPRAIALAAAGILARSAAERPVLLAVDDLHWLDHPSGRALASALRRLSDERVGLVATVREPIDAEFPFGLDRSVEDARIVPVGPLSLGGVYELLHEKVGLGLPRQTLLRLFEATGGNPYFALEIGTELIRRGERTLGPSIPIPASLRELLRARLARLPAATRSALLAAAALADPSASTLEAVLGAEPANAALARAVRAGIVELDGERVSFTHPLLAAVCYGDALPAERRAVHAKLAETISDPEERARHLSLAAGETRDAAVSATLEEAAGTALARGAPDTAADLAQRAYELTPPDDAAAVRRRILASAHARFTAGDRATARQQLEEAVEAWPPGDDRTDALIRLGVVVAGDDSARAEAVYERVLATTDDPRVLADVHQKLARSILVSGSLDEAAPHAEAAVEAAEASGDAARLASALAASALIDFFRGRDFHEARLLRAIELHESLTRGGLWLSEHPAMVLASIELRLGAFDAAEQRFASLAAEADEAGDYEALPSALYWLSALALRRAAWNRALELAGRADGIARQVGEDLLLSAICYVTSLARAHLGAIDEARAAATEGLALASAGGNDTQRTNNLAALGFADASVERYDDAHVHLAEAVELARRSGVREPTVLLVVAEDAEILAQLGETARAAELVTPFERDAIALDRPLPRALALRSRGVIAAAEGDLEGAAAALAAALEQHARVEQPFERARTLLALGAFERRQQRKARARATLEEAASELDRLGAPLWRDRADRELGRIGGRRAARDGALSATELQIAKLVAEGRTNQEVADALSLSPRTVQWNLSKVYRRLGVRSRTELAASLSQLS